jgi:DUF1680 family protein
VKGNSHQTAIGVKTRCVWRLSLAVRRTAAKPLFGFQSAGLFIIFVRFSVAVLMAVRFQLFYIFVQRSQTQICSYTIDIHNVTHLYDNSELRWKLDSGNPITIAQTTRYPWEGDVTMRVSPAQPEEFTLYTRIPGWSRRSSVKVNGKAAGQPVAGEYLGLRRTWTANDLVEISFGMESQIVHACAAVADDTGRIAVQRGPVIFCMEQLDQAEQAPQQFPLMSAKRTGAASSTYEPALLDGVVTIEYPGTIEETPSAAALYSAGPIKRNARSTSLKLIPYYAWANREPSSMQVWIPYIES